MHAVQQSHPCIFQAKELSKIYPMGDIEVHALRGVNLSLYRGEFVVLLGSSGSGKSTLLNILGGLDVPTAGEVLYNGQDISRASDAVLTRFRRRHVGFVFQFYNLIPSLTARENVAVVTDIAEDPLSPVVSSSGWRLPAPLPSARQCCYVMSRPERWIPKPASRCCKRWHKSIANWVPPR